MVCRAFEKHYNAVDGTFFDAIRFNSRGSAQLTGGAPGLQIRCGALNTSRVGSIPMHFRHFFSALKRPLKTGSLGLSTFIHLYCYDSGVLLFNRRARRDRRDNDYYTLSFLCALSVLSGEFSYIIIFIKLCT